MSLIDVDMVLDKIVLEDFVWLQPDEGPDSVKN